MQVDVFQRTSPHPLRQTTEALVVVARFLSKIGKIGKAHLFPISTQETNQGTVTSSKHPFSSFQLVLEPPTRLRKPKHHLKSTMEALKAKNHLKTTVKPGSKTHFNTQKKKQKQLYISIIQKPLQNRCKTDFPSLWFYFFSSRSHGCVGATWCPPPSS